jgi:hypothetical protein
MYYITGAPPKVNQEMAILQNRRERALRRDGIDASYVANGACLA